MPSDSLGGRLEGDPEAPRRSIYFMPLEFMLLNHEIPLGQFSLVENSYPSNVRKAYASMVLLLLLAVTEEQSQSIQMVFCYVLTKVIIEKKKLQLLA